MRANRNDRVTPAARREQAPGRRFRKPAHGATRKAPAPVAAAETGFPAVERQFAKFQTDEHLAGLVWGVVRDGRIVHLGASGVQDIETRAPVNAETMFRIASMSKAFTALAIMQLVEEGALALDQPVREILGADLPLIDPRVTIAHLLQHTSGIGDYIELPAEEMYGEFFDIPEPDTLVFLSWFTGGEVFRSGCTYSRGSGKIFYFRPGHETYPTYYRSDIRRVIANAAQWAAPQADSVTVQWDHVPQPLEKIR